MDLLLQLDEVPDLTSVLKPEAIKRAWIRTLRKATKRIASTSAKLLGDKKGLAQKMVRKRIGVFIKNNKELPAGKIWMGTNPVKAKYVGKLRQLKKGVKARSEFWESAFIVEKLNGHAFYRSSDQRFPIDSAYADIESDAEIAFYQAMNQVLPSIQKTYKQELNYELLKAQGKL